MNYLPILLDMLWHTLSQKSHQSLIDIFYLLKQAPNCKLEVCANFYLKYLN
jgi:hypothetical protein